MVSEQTPSKDELNGQSNLSTVTAADEVLPVVTQSQSPPTENRPESTGTTPSPVETPPATTQSPAAGEVLITSLRDAGGLNSDTQGVLEELAEGGLVTDADRLAELNTLTLDELVVQPEFQQLVQSRKETVLPMMGSEAEQQRDEFMELIPHDIVDDPTVTVQQGQEKMIEQLMIRGDRGQPIERKAAESKVKRIFASMLAEVGGDFAEGWMNSSMSTFIGVFFDREVSQGHTWGRMQERGESAELISLAQVENHFKYKENVVRSLNNIYELLEHTGLGSRPRELKHPSEAANMTPAELRAVFQELQHEVEKRGQPVELAIEQGIAWSLTGREDNRGAVLDDRVLEEIKGYAENDRKFDRLVKDFKDQRAQENVSAETSQQAAA